MKKLMILPLLILVLVLGTIQVFAVEAEGSCGFTTQMTTGMTLTNNSLINVSFANLNGSTINISVSLISASTRNNSITVGIITNLTNHTRSSINMTLNNSFAFDDSNDYTLNCQCRSNNTVYSCNSTRTITLDRTRPATPSAITFTNPVKDTNTITATINLELANQCFIKFGGNKIAMTRSGSTCTYTAARGTNSPADGDYQMSIIADDRTNETASADQSVTIDANPNGDGGWLGGGLQYTSSDNQGIQGALGGGSSNPFAAKQTGLKSIPPLGWVIIAIVAVMLFGGKKK